MKTNKKLAANKIISLILLSLIVTFVIVFTFSTDYFPAKSKAYKEHLTTYKSIIKQRDSLLFLTIKGSAIENKIITIKENSNKKLKYYTKVKNEIKISDSFLGYTSYKYFILGIGRSLLALLSSLLLLYVVIKFIRQKILIKFYLILSFTLVVTSGYWLAWSLLNFSLDPKRPFDFPRSYYNIALYILPTVIFFAAYFLFKYLKTAEEKKNELSRELYNQIIVNNEKYIKIDSVLEYYQDNLELFAKLEKK